MNIRTYARRQPNPFAGVLQIAESDAARAFSANGVVWRIQTLANRPDHTWRSDADMPTACHYFNWGLWSPNSGFRQVIANPILDIGAMENAAKSLITALETQLEQLPFALADRYEHWACDRAGRPVALLGTAISVEDSRNVKTDTWQAVDSADQAFVSGTLAKAGDHHQRHSDFLDQQMLGRTHHRCWFKREPHETATPLHAGETLEDTAFPELGFSEEWDDPMAQGAFADYVRWCAPLLLTLPLSGQRRGQLEKQAKQRSTLVDDLYRLYPAIIDPQLIEQARVQARFLRSK